MQLGFCLYTLLTFLKAKFLFTICPSNANFPTTFLNTSNLVKAKAFDILNGQLLTAHVSCSYKFTDLLIYHFFLYVVVDR